MSMGKLLAAMLVVVALASAYPIITHKYDPPESISTDGDLIDKQLHETTIQTGFFFVAAQLILAVLIWAFTNRKPGSKLKSFPGGATVMVIAAFVLVGTELLAFGMMGQKAWGSVYLTPPKAEALQVQAQAGQFAYYFRYPGADGKFGGIHPDKIDDGNQNYFGLDPANDPESRDDIVSGELVIPVNREVQLLMHAKDVGHSFYVRELRIQQDFVPGLELAVHFTATKIGRYEIVCTQLCGLGHYSMKAYLKVISANDFDKWLKEEAEAQ
jgi:cytochrome c oxidase subunit II